MFSTPIQQNCNAEIPSHLLLHFAFLEKKIKKKCGSIDYLTKRCPLVDIYGVLKQLFTPGLRHSTPVQLDTAEPQKKYRKISVTPFLTTTEREQSKLVKIHFSKSLSIVGEVKISYS